ncbi:hypothetical protein ACT7DQ_11250 [Bacillus cereus]
MAIDQGGIFETTDRITTHDNPTYEKHGVVHYAVANIVRCSSTYVNSCINKRNSTICSTNCEQRLQRCLLRQHCITKRY